MSILIKGMEMPTKGYRLILVHADGTVQTTGGKTTAVPVPKHGRLVDVDALPKTRVEWEDVINAPTIIPAEEGET